MPDLFVSVALVACHGHGVASVALQRLRALENILQRRLRASAAEEHPKHRQSLRGDAGTLQGVWIR